MATEATWDTETLAKIRIPAEHLESLDRLFRSLRQKILHQAVVQAAARSAGDESGVVTQEDLMQCAKDVFSAGPSEIEQAFATPERF